MSEDMTLPAHLDVIAQAQRLARPVTLLRPAGEGQPVAMWGGSSSVPLPPELVVTDEDTIEDGAFFAHWLSVDARMLPLPFAGCLSLYVNEAEVQPLILHDPDATLQTTGGTKLYAHESAQLPHVDALFRHGAPALQQWMADVIGEAPEVLLTESDVGAHQHPALDQLDQTLRAAHPMWTGDTTAQLGGWCWGWPDEAWDERENQGQRLLLTTFENSEPWIEVWWTGQDFEAIAHVT